MIWPRSTTTTQCFDDGLEIIAQANEDESSLAFASGYVTPPQEDAVEIVATTDWQVSVRLSADGTDAGPDVNLLYLQIWRLGDDDEWLMLAQDAVDLGLYVSDYAHQLTVKAFIPRGETFKIIVVALDVSDYTASRISGSIIGSKS